MKKQSCPNAAGAAEESAGGGSPGQVLAAFFGRIRATLWSRAYLLPFAITSGLALAFCGSYLRLKLNEGARPDFTWLQWALVSGAEQRKEFLSSLTTLPRLANQTSYDNGTELTTYSYYVTWSVLTIAYVLACLAALLVGGRVILKSLGNTMGWEKANLLAWLLAASALTALLFSGLQSDFGKVRCADKSFFSQLMCAEKSVRGRESDLPDENGVLGGEHGRVSKIHLRLDALGMALIVFVAGAASVALFPLSHNSNKQTLDGQRRHLTAVLYAGAAVLITAALRVDAMFHWALSFSQPLGDADIKVKFLYESAASVAASMTTMLGGVYSLFLAAVYLPAALEFNRRAKGIGGDNLFPSLREQVVNLAAVLGPLLAGSVGEVLGRLKG